MCVCARLCARVLRVCKCVVCASLERKGERVRKAEKRESKRKKNLFVSYGNTRRQTQALINYTLHLHIPGIRHYANSEAICIMDSSCCLSCLMPPFYLIMEKKNKKGEKEGRMPHSDPISSVPAPCPTSTNRLLRQPHRTGEPI